MIQQTDDIRFYVVLDSKIKSNGLSKVYLRLLKAGKKRDFYTGVSWPKDFFDKKNERLHSRFPDDPDVQANNMTIGQYKTIVHQIKINAFINNGILSLDEIIEKLKNITPETDFIRFALEEGTRLCRSNVFSHETWKRHRVAIKKVSEFFGRDVVGLHEITTETIASMDAYFRKNLKAHNTIAGYHKDIKGYINKAIKAGLIKRNPYEDFHFKYVDGEREVLLQSELKTLMGLFNSGELIPTEHEILRRFLFSCLTGIRISDTHFLKSDQIKDDHLLLKPKKGMKYGKMIRLPLSRTAKSLVADREGIIFTKAADQHINRTLKIIAAHAGIKKRLTYHCARDTFGTIFIERGGDVKSLCDLMGHSSIRVTMIYLKMSDQRKVQLINNFDGIFE